jgi:ABC-type multidrug transport system ATPase subunit
MKIRLSNTGKRFNREWIFRKADIEFNSPTAYAITGPNGSGKSTLLQCIGGLLQINEGSISYDANGVTLSLEQVFKHISFCAPYLEVVEEMNLLEFLQFHQAFKPLLKDITVHKAIEVIGLQAAAHKQIRHYSSGMKQRVKLAQAIFSDTPVVLLDEPCSNLDSAGIALYHSLIATYCKNRLVIVCSNDEVEYSFCQEHFSILDWK